MAHSLSEMRILHLLIAAASLVATPASAAPEPDTYFLDFPYVDSISGAKAPAFAWLTRQADKSTIYFARAPEFRRIALATRSDEHGDPITAVLLSPDGTRLVYQTGVPRPGEAFNPAAMVPAPEARLWLMPTNAGAKAVAIGEGSDPTFSDDGRTLLIKRGGDLYAIDTHAPSA
jgi:hypothetical protein